MPAEGTKKKKMTVLTTIRPPWRTSLSMLDWNLTCLAPSEKLVGQEEATVELSRELCVPGYVALTWLLETGNPRNHERKMLAVWPDQPIEARSEHNWGQTFSLHRNKEQLWLTENWGEAKGKRAASIDLPDGTRALN